MSLLSWERGLKFCPLDVCSPTPVSLLSWERGLKSSYAYQNFCEMYVAPLVGAWIEILSVGRLLSYPFVAPLVGAWIEMSNGMFLMVLAKMSLLSWERGLKYLSPVVFHPL